MDTKILFNLLVIKLFISILISVVNCFELFSNDPDIDRNSSELIESRGFISQTHNVITEDGYIITIFRIINPYLKKSSKPYPILLQHGFIQNSDMWLITSPGIIESDGIYVEDNTLVNNCSSIDSYGRTSAFVLSACGYDVWIGNIRGNKYSSHLFLDPDRDKKFWSFTMDHFSAYDLTAMIQYVLQTTNSETIGYIGHSLGNLISFQLLSSQTEYSKLIKPFIAMGPFVYLSHVKSPLLRFITSLEPLLSSEVIPFPALGPLSILIGRYFCGNSLFKEFCVLFDFLFGGFDYPNLNKTFIPRLFARFPDSTSSLALAHCGQVLNIGNFAYYDYGVEKNLKIYRQPEPPNYDLSKIDSKYIVLMSGLNDYLSDQGDIDLLRNQLKVPLYEDYIVPYRLWTHSDFLFANSLGKYINPHILKILDSLKLQN